MGKRGAVSNVINVIEVDWLLRESDGKLTYTGFRLVKEKPQQVLMVEVVDARKGILSSMFQRQCEHVAGLMRKKVEALECRQQGEFASGS